jgi:hypothetical protein
MKSTQLIYLTIHIFGFFQHSTLKLPEILATHFKSNPVLSLIQILPTVSTFTQSF